MSYKMCATKRDVNTVGKPLQYFTPSQWIVKTTSYPSGYDISDNYELLQDGVLTNLKCTISLINGCVYEGMQVTINDNSLLGQLGTLHQKNYADQCTTKKYVLESNCSLTGQSASYDSNRLIREEDIIAPRTVLVYYDPRYLIVEEFKTDAVLKFPITSVNPGAPERTPGDELDPLMNREFAYQAIECTKGNKVQVRQKSTVNSDLVLNAVYAYDNLDAPMYELNTPGYEGSEFIASDNCFITFDLVQQTYRLSAAAPVIDCATQCGLTIAAYLPPDEDIYYLASSGVDDPKLPICRPSEEEYILVPNEAEVNIILNVNTYETENTTTCVLRNLTTNETTTLTLNDDNECIFKMPSSDCRLETNVVIHKTTGDTGFEYEDRILTIKSNQLERVIVNGSTYSFYDGVAEVNIPCDESPSALAEVYYDAGISAIYHVRAYPSDTGPTNMPRSYTTPHTTLSLSTNMTLEVSYSPISCEYKTIGGQITGLEKGTDWGLGNNITDVKEYDGFYRLSTGSAVSYTPVGTPFYKKEQLESVKFYTTEPSFAVLKNSFSGCLSLHEVGLPDVTSMINDSAFSLCVSLKNLEIPYNLSTLGTDVFEFNSYKSIYTYPSYTTTNEYTDALIFNVDQEYKSQLSIIPEKTFSTCFQLKEVYLPASITKIEKGAFHECVNLLRFQAPNLWYVEQDAFYHTLIDKSSITKQQFNDIKDSVDGFTFEFYHNRDKDTTSLQVTPVASYIHPDSTKTGGHILYKMLDRGKKEAEVFGLWRNTISVVEHAVNGAKKLNIISVQPTLKYIGKYAFANNKKVTELNSPLYDSNIYTEEHNNCVIDDYAFWNNKKLGHIYDPCWKIESIGKYAFANCPHMAPLNFYKSGVKKIDDYAFANSIQGAYLLYKKISIQEQFVLAASAIAYAAATFCCMYLGGIIGAALETAPQIVQVVTKLFKLNNLVISGIHTIVGGVKIVGDLLNTQHFNTGGITWPTKKDLLKDYDEYLNQYYNSEGYIHRNDVNWAESWIVKEDMRVGDTILYDKPTLEITGSDKDGWTITASGDIEGYTIQEIGYDGKTIDVPDLTSGSMTSTDFSVSAAVSAALMASAYAYPAMQAVRENLWKAYNYPIRYYMTTDRLNFDYAQGGIDSNRGVYSIMFPETLSYLGKYAFLNCIDLYEVFYTSCPSDVKEGTFKGCKYLTNVGVVRNVLQDDGTYKRDENLNDYQILYIGSEAFRQCPLAPVSINKLLRNAYIVEDYAFCENYNIFSKTLNYNDIQDYVNKSQGKAIIIPPQLTTIGKYAFSGANIVCFLSERPDTLNIDPTAFQCYYSDDYNPYLSRSASVFIVPKGCEKQYLDRFTELKLINIPIYSTNDEGILTYYATTPR